MMVFVLVLFALVLLSKGAHSCQYAVYSSLLVHMSVRFVTQRYHHKVYMPKCTDTRAFAGCLTLYFEDFLDSGEEAAHYLDMEEKLALLAIARRKACLTQISPTIYVLT